MTLLANLATVFGTLGALAFLPQAIKIYKLKSAKEISPLTFSFFLVSAMVWIMYGLEIKNIALLSTNIFAAINEVLILIGWGMYRKKPKIKRNRK